MSEGKTPQRERERERERIDEVLAAWPAPEQSAVECDQVADKVIARLKDRDAAGGGSDEELLAAPLPATPEEVQRSVPTMATSSRKRDSAALKALAKMAELEPKTRPSQPPAVDLFAEPNRAGEPAAEQRSEERKENSGLIHLASLAAADASPGDADAAAAHAPAAPAASATAASAPLRAVPSVALGRAPEKRTNWMMFGGMIAAAAVAAGALIMVRGSSPTNIAPIAASGPVTVSGQGTATATTAKPIVTPLAATDKGVDPMTLPPVDTAGANPSPGPAAAKPGPVVAAGGPPPPAAASAPPPAAASAEATDPKLIAVVPTPADPAASTSLTQLMQQAAGVAPSATTTDTPTTDVAATSTMGTTGTVPLKPSQGAVAGALGAAMPSARACLGPDDPISRATVTFQSDGTVGSVSVSGGAAGKPAEGCIRSALMKARVQPFALPTFSVPATIRAN